MRTVLAAAILAALVVPTATADASKWSQQVTCKPRLKQDYRKHYRQVRHRLGQWAPGRQILKHGVRFKGVTFVATCGELRRSRGQLKKLLVRPTYLSVSGVPPAWPPAGVQTRSYAPSGVAACIVQRESGGNPQASNGSHFGIGQWTYEAWARHGGTKYSSDPRGATYQQQLEILNQGLTAYGCRDWCPFDGC